MPGVANIGGCCCDTEECSDGQLCLTVTGCFDEPVEDAEVTVKTDPGGVIVGTCMTDEDGQCCVTGLPPGDYTYDVDADGFVSVEDEPFTVNDDCDDLLDDVALEPASGFDCDWTDNCNCGAYPIPTSLSISFSGGVSGSSGGVMTSTGALFYFDHDTGFSFSGGGCGTHPVYVTWRIERTLCRLYSEFSVYCPGVGTCNRDHTFLVPGSTYFCRNFSSCPCPPGTLFSFAMTSGITVDCNPFIYTLSLPSGLFLSDGFGNSFDLRAIYPAGSVVTIS